MKAANIHPYLLESWPRRRTELLMQRAERLITLELVNERTVEDHYDEAQRLRLHRVIDTQVLRGSLTERYAQVLLAVADGQTERPRAAAQLVELLGADAARAAARCVAHDLSEVLASYKRVVPADQWPTLLCMAPTAGEGDALSARLESLGFEGRANGLRRFGIVKIACPPELTVVDALARGGSVQCLADPDTPVSYPQPQPIGTQMADAVSMLGLTPEMQHDDPGQCTIAVLDTGLDLSHPAFRRVGRSDCRNFTRGASEDESGHGTHVAFIAGGGPVSGHGQIGVAPRCRLIAGKVMSGNRFNTLEEILEGMAWAVFDQRADILSLSLGEEATPANGQSIWSRACDEAFNQGTIVCVAAGNPDVAMPETIKVPADAQTAVAVGAIDIAGQLASFSAKGSPHAGHPLYGKPNCVAPGVNVMAARSSASTEGAGLLVPDSGTSMAAPAVAGCLALLKSRARQLGWEIAPAELLDIFYGACRPLTAEDGEAYSPEFEVGHGLVNMQDAMAQVEGRAASGRVFSPARAWPGRVPHATPTEGTKMTADAPPAPRTFAPNTCYRCGRGWLTRVDMFSDACRCSTCGAPICRVCWGTGFRGCDSHPKADRLTPPMRQPEPPSIGAQAPRATQEVRMPEVNVPEPCRLDAAQTLAVEGYFARFSTNARELVELVQPVTGKAVSRQDPPQSPRMRFGRVQRINYSGGAWILAHSPLAIVAVALEGAGLERRAGTCVPVDTLIAQLGSPDGLDFDDKTYYAVGVFSPFGWPPEWNQHPHMTANVEIHLVEYRDGRWHTTSPRSSRFAEFFTEGADDAIARAARGLAEDPHLRMARQQVRIEAFCERWQVSRDAVIAAVGKSSDRFLLVPADAPRAIQRSHLG